MVEITDINKLRPELMDVTDAQFERLATEFEMARIERARIKAEKIEAEKLEKAQHAFDDLREAIDKLAELGHLPQRLVEVLTDKDGKLSPHRFLKRPR
ncbi:MAG: hypothetical protein RLQ25_03090 [Alphaproteobacteria bacterium]